MTQKDLSAAVRASLEKGGWLKLFKGEPKKIARMVRSAVVDILMIAEKAPVGAVLERRGGQVNIRRLKAVRP